MFDAEIQRATTATLEAILVRLGPTPAGSEAQDLVIRVARELRYRRRFEQEQDRKKHIRQRRRN